MLRDYQQRAVDDVRRLISEGHNGICVHGPTGSGKTHAMLDLLADGTPQVIITHRRILLAQLARHLDNMRLRFGYRAAGERPDYYAPIQLCMIQTEAGRMKNPSWLAHPGCEIVHIDECHLIKSHSALKLVAAYPEAAVVGWTATPSEIGKIAPTIVPMSSVRELINLGHLVPPWVVTPTEPDIARLSSMQANMAGEYSGRDVERVMPRNTLIGNVIEHYNALNPDRKPAVLFAGGVPHSLFMARRMWGRGIRAAHISGESIWLPGERQERPSSPEERSELFWKLRNGHLDVLCTRFVLREGWDEPCIQHVILATAFGSRSAFVQACGRGLRPYPGKDYCCFQDHGANARRFPMLESGHPWNPTVKADTAHQEYVEARIRGDEPEPISCPRCHTLRLSGKQCLECGYCHTTSVRHILEVDGTLRELKDNVVYRRQTPTSLSPEEQWVRMFWGARKNSPRHTMRQIYCFMAKVRGWQWAPKDLPFMPQPDKQHLWKWPVGRVPMRDLNPKENQE